VGLLTRSDLLRALAFGDEEPNDQAAFFDWDARIDEVELEPAVTVSAATSLGALLPMMRSALQLRAVVVDEREQAIGMISESDLLTRVEKSQRTGVMAALHEQSELAQGSFTQIVTDLMTTPVITVHTESRALDAIRLLMENQLKRLPVIDCDGKVIGLVNRRTLLYGLLRKQTSQHPN
jgi:CBS domain-containing protein